MTPFVSALPSVSASDACINTQDLRCEIMSQTKRQLCCNVWWPLRCLGSDGSGTILGRQQFAVQHIFVVLWEITGHGYESSWANDRDYEVHEETDRQQGNADGCYTFASVYFLMSLTGKYIEWKGQGKTVCLSGFAFQILGSKRKKEEYVTLQVIKDSPGNKEHLVLS